MLKIFIIAKNLNIPHFFLFLFLLLVLFFFQYCLLLLSCLPLCLLFNLFLASFILLFLFLVLFILNIFILIFCFFVFYLIYRNFSLLNQNISVFFSLLEFFESRKWLTAVVFLATSRILGITYALMLEL